MFHILMDGMLGAYCTIESVFSVEEAIAYLQAHDVDLIFTDLMMPVQPGTELIRYCRNHKQFADIPVIALSATGDSRLIDRALNLGANKSIAKPFGRMDLLEAMDMVLEKHVRDV
jgi:CheY-like chemotaxis protein